MKENFNKKIPIIFFIGLVFLVATIIGYWFDADNKNQDASKNNEVVRLGYFHGGRTHLFYRAYIGKYFKDGGVDVKLITKALRQDKLFEVPDDHELMEKKRKEIPGFGRMTGLEIVEEMENGNLVGGLIGESSFVSAVSRGAPIVAVAMLGHDQKDRPGKAIVLRNDVKIDSPNDFNGKTLTYRLSGPGDEIFLREFLEAEGINIDNVSIIKDMIDDKQESTLRDGVVDGGFYHFHIVRKMIDSGTGYLYRPMNWINPEISSALLVFRKDYVENNRDEVQKIVNAYVKRIKFEKSLTEKERKEPKEFGLQMESDAIEGMNIPQYDFPPSIKVDLLDEIQDLMIKYKKIDSKIDIENYVDYDFVDEAIRNIRYFKLKL